MHIRTVVSLLMSIPMLATSTFAAEPAMQPSAMYLDPTQPVDARVDDLIGRLSLEEKAQLLDHRSPDLARLNIKSDKWNQCLHGVWWDRPTTMFPVSIALAATWDPGLAHEEAVAISDEARAIYNRWHQQPSAPGEKKGLIYRAPVINISRNPYWGRINECYGEDPYLTGRIGVAYIKGLQGDDPRYLKLAATLKHYAVNNVEKDRKKLSATVDERWLREYWLPHFHDCVVEGQAQSVMASYNAINGVPLAVNKLMLTDILKNEWGFTGAVVSDLGGIDTYVKGHKAGKESYESAVADAIKAGCDFSDKEFAAQAASAVKDGLLPEARLNEALHRLLRVRFRLGEFDPAEMVPYSKISPDVIGNAEHRQLALKVARQSIVLLTNKNNLLPLDKSKIKSIAVIGPHAEIFTAGGYSGKVTDPVTPLKGIQNRVAQGTQVVAVAGAQLTPPRRGASAPAVDPAAEMQKAVDAAKNADVAIVYVGTTLAIEAEDRDRTALGLPGNQEDLVKAVIAANPRTVVVEMNAGPLAVPWIAENAPAMIEAWWAGEEGGNAIADVIFGDTNPAGRLPLTVYASADQIPPQDEYDISKGFTYMYLHGQPLFPFGHGLSYTQFSYTPLSVGSNRMSAQGGSFTAWCDVKNTGTRDGEEVVQLYIHQQNATIPVPAKKLVAFRRIALKTGESATVSFEVPATSLAIWDVTQHAFVVQPGTFDVMVGSSSADIKGTSQIHI